MSALPPVLQFGNDWFSDNRTSSHHVARQLARHTRVLYVGTPGLRPPSGTSRDLKRIAGKLARTFQRFDGGDGVAVRTLTQLPLHGSRLARALNSVTSGAYARAVLRSEGMNDPIVWCTVPHVAPFVARIPKSLLVYHCIDDYSALPGVDVAAVRQLDEQLARQADLVVAASRPVFEAKRRLNPTTALMPHGVDVRHFAAAAEHGSLPPDIAHLPRPIVGFTGLIERWIDLDLVGWLATQLPHVTFVMIGRVAVPDDDVPRASNLVMLGPRPYESLPLYGRAFDAAIIPYHLTPQVIAANPLKLREYLAMGLPVVSVSTPEIDQFAGVVSVTHSRQAFLAALKQTLNTPRDANLVRRRMDAVRDVSWESRVDGLIPHLISILGSRRERRVA